MGGGAPVTAGDGGVLAAFERTGAILRGHFLLTSGRHADTYLQSALALQWPEEAERLGAGVAGLLRSHGPEAVVGPALGAVVLAHEAGRALGVRAMFAERGPDGRMALRRGFGVRPGERVAVVENVVTTGGSAREVVDLLEGLGARVVAVAALVDRSGGTAAFPVPFAALVRMELATYDPDSCPLCARGIPAVKPGSRR
jgi:orotate phosphoribosyltransferase